MSDKHRISLFDDSKFEDATLDIKGVGDHDSDDDDDDSSGDNHQIIIRNGDRESMVLMGDNVEVVKKRAAKYSGILRSKEGDSNPMSDDE